jgi:hypothetical protein
VKSTVKSPMREKYVDEAARVWAIFGVHSNGSVDVSDGNRDVFIGLSPDVAEQVVAAQARFRAELYLLLCHPAKPSERVKAPENSGELRDLIKRLVPGVLAREILAATEIEKNWVAGNGGKSVNPKEDREDETRI